MYYFSFKKIKVSLLINPSYKTPYKSSRFSSKVFTMIEKKSYINQPQLVIKKTGKIVRFYCKHTGTFYVQLNHLQALCYGGKHSYIYANLYERPNKKINKQV